MTAHIARSPLRISLGGGGTDLPSYSNVYGGFLIAGAINRYVHVVVNSLATDDILLRYSEIERVKTVDEVKHPIIREAMRLTKTKPGVEVTAFSDVPAGTGLGSSGSFGTALLRAIHAHNHTLAGPKEIAQQACHIEIDVLREPVGKQDQYIAALGGLTVMEISKDGVVYARPVRCNQETIDRLTDNLLLFATGTYRSASAMLSDQDMRTKAAVPAMVDNMHIAKNIGYRSLEAIESGNLEQFGELMHEHWEHKKRRSPGMSNAFIDTLYDTGMAAGALGGKVVGAGGGGYVMFYTEEPTKLRNAMRGMAPELRFGFDFQGTTLLTA